MFCDGIRLCIELGVHIDTSNQFIMSVLITPVCINVFLFIFIKKKCSVYKGHITFKLSLHKLLEAVVLLHFAEYNCPLKSWVGCIMLGTV
jgi:hypothetical protein